MVGVEGQPARRRARQMCGLTRRDRALGAPQPLGPTGAEQPGDASLMLVGGCWAASHPVKLRSA